MMYQWQRISSSFRTANDDDHFDVIVIGSGYGGGVAAARLADPNRKLAVLERGREIAPGDYPRDAKAAADETQVTLSQTGETLGKADGLIDLRINDDVNVLVGCGLGGTSLINANVAIEPDKRAYNTWPKAFKNGDILKKHFERARGMLGSNPYPKGRELPKLTALEKVAKGLKVPEAFGRPDINVTFTDSINMAGIQQAACTGCGDCVSGCNYGSKNTVLMNYLPYARARGAEIFTNTEVTQIERVEQNGEKNEHWAVKAFDPTSKGKKVKTLTADVVILAAGTLGSTEILLRSRSEKLKFSDKLGTHFSGNGDVWAFGYNANMPTEDNERAPVYGFGAGLHNVTAGDTPKGGEKYKPGPCITGIINLNDPTDLTKSMVIEEGVAPGALAPALAAGFPMLEALIGDPFRFGDTPLRAADAAWLGEKIESDPLNIGETVYDGPMSRFMSFLIMGHDDAAGQLELKKDRVTVNWGGGGADPAILLQEPVIRKACDVIQAEYLPNPIWQDEFGKRLLSVHPLGGCGLGETHEDGVIDNHCQVFKNDGKVHEGLYVCDGAAIPRPLGVNPHLTITALAEYAVEKLAIKQGWEIDLSRIESQDTFQPSQEADIEKLFVDVLAAMRAINTAINSKAYELAGSMLIGVWRQFREFMAKKVDDVPLDFSCLESIDGIEFWQNEERLNNSIGPALTQILDILDPIEPLLKDKNFSDILTHLENEFGDFSPSAKFPEKMQGYVSNSGLNDVPAPNFNPYSLAESTDENACSLEGWMVGKTVRSVIDPESMKTQHATIEGGKVLFNGKVYKVKNGKFRFLQPNPNEIELWEITYTADLKRLARTLRFKGRKTLQRREGSNWWSDLCDLNVDIEEKGIVIARGMISVSFEEAIKQANSLKIEFKDLATVGKIAPRKIIKSIRSCEPFDVGKLGLGPELIQAIIYGANKVAPELQPSKMVENLYAAKIMAKFASLVLRTYGGISSYMMNFPSTGPHKELPAIRLEHLEVFFPEVEPNVFTKLTRYKGGTNGPIILAGGFGTRASSLATPTVEQNIVQMLVEKEYDVWLFDYRGSGELEASLGDFNIDDVAMKDWPKAIDMVCELTGSKDVQALVHCVGSMSLFMAIMRGEKRVRSIIASQLGPHPITNWFKFAQGDSGTADMVANGVPEPLWPALDLLSLPDELKEMAKQGLSVIDPRSPSFMPELDNTIDAMMWDVPNFAPIQCYSPTCHRINFIFGPSYLHDQLNQETHNAIRDFFGPIGTTPMLHNAKMFTQGHVIGEDGFDYMDQARNFTMPVHFIHGARNQEVLPEGTMRSLEWLKMAHSGKSRDRFTRHVFQDYGHMDTFIGKNAHNDIFPHILKKLEDFDDSA